MITRQQRLLSHAMKHIHIVEGQPKKVQTIYGGLCHKFPVLVRTCGLCQALAFIESKVGEADSHDERKQAYQFLRGHICDIMVEEQLGIAQDPTAICTAVAGMSLTQYMLATRLLLKAWVFYKRFAVSVLKVEDASQDEDAIADEGGDHGDAK